MINWEEEEMLYQEIIYNCLITNFLQKCCTYVVPISQK